MTFKDWLEQFVNEKSERGELATGFMKDPKFLNEMNTWGEVFYRLHINDVDMKLIGVFSEMWREYKAEHGENTVFFELMDTDTNIYFSDDITEKEAYQFYFKLESLGIEFDLISEPEGSSDGDDFDYFLIEINQYISGRPPLNLGEILNRLSIKKYTEAGKIVHFPLKGIVH